MTQQRQARAATPASRQRKWLAWWSARGKMRTSGALVGRIQALMCYSGHFSGQIDDRLRAQTRVW